MSSNVHFTQHADDAYLVERLHQIMDQSWRAIEAAKAARSIDRLVAIVVQLIGAPMFAQAARLLEQHRARPRESLRLVGMELLAQAVCAEALRRWIDIDGLVINFIEEHAFIVDKQQRFYELTGEKACFFALMHLCLGEICEASDRRVSAGEARQHTLFLRQGSAHFSLFDLLIPIYERLSSEANSEVDLRARLAIVGRHLLAGAEMAMSLSEQQPR